ncbi:DoxX family membrane protein [Streptomyces longispororuber]|uniref:DoxX family membrane protein n=1 Tax=Streptomyces longispororuber TaxID=68230 RepID=UPI00210C94C3|nr:DoxX family membrane protein [Streptomyces longispororuber]MCQ4210207.1 DoxX family membrane protein [Streptomyces longispororuber]
MALHASERPTRHSAAGTPRRNAGSQDGVVVRSAAARGVLAAARVLVGFYFLWAFLDKTFGFGRSTPSSGSWLNGGHPTEGFLLHGTTGPFAHMFDSVAGAWWLDTLFMAGLLGVGLAMILGIGMRIAAGAGTLMMAFMWLVTLWPGTNPFLDDHWMIALVLLATAATGAGGYFGLGRAWARLPIVRRNRWLI